MFCSAMFVSTVRSEVDLHDLPVSRSCNESQEIPEVVDTAGRWKISDVEGGKGRVPLKTNSRPFRK